MADFDDRDEQAELETVEETPEPSKEPAKPAKKGSGSKELEKLYERRAELKRTPKDQLKDGDFAEVKRQIAELEAELGIQ